MKTPNVNKNQIDKIFRIHTPAFITQLIRYMEVQRESYFFKHFDMSQSGLHFLSCPTWRMQVYIHKDHGKKPLPFLPVV